MFDFFANPTNDNLWRTEINKSILDGALQLGATVSEYSNLSKKASNNLLVSPTFARDDRRANYKRHWRINNREIQ